MMEKGCHLEVCVDVDRIKSHNNDGNKANIKIKLDQTDDLNNSDKRIVESGNDRLDGNGLIKDIEDNNMGYNIDGIDDGYDKDESNGLTSNCFS